MPADPENYHADLGASPTATADELKSVFEALVKIYHPDVNKDPAARVKYDRISEAYRILCNPIERQKYDLRLAGNVAVNVPANDSRPAGKNFATKQPARPNTPQYTPILCSACGKVATLPRQRVFRQVLSLVVFTRVTPQGGTFCQGCATRLAIRASASSAAFGWWGVPWGPLLTIREIVRNAFGGEANRQNELKLTWHNAVAFEEQGKLELAAALAARVADGFDRNLAAEARTMLQRLRTRNAVPANVSAGAAARLAASLLMIAMGSIVPMTAAAMLVPPEILRATLGNWTGNAQTEPAQFPHGSKPGKDGEAQTGPVIVDLQPLPPLQPAPAPAPQPAPLPQPAPAPQPAPPPVAGPVAETCKKPPKNGTILAGKIPRLKFGHEISFDNGSEGDAIIKLVRLGKNNQSLVLFAEQGKKSKVQNLPDGNYEIYYAFGDGLKADCRSFNDPRAVKVDESYAFKLVKTRTRINAKSLTITPYKVVGGNLTTSPVTDEEFNAK